MAVNKVLTANGSKGHHRFTLTVNEDTTSGNSSFMSYSLTISPIQSGWDWNISGVSYYVTVGSNHYSGNIYQYQGYSTETISSGSNIEIVHNTDGTKTIDVAFEIVDTTTVAYTPGNALASDTLTLTPLHKAPDITGCTITAENNATLTSLGLTTTTIAQFLSNKTFTITATPYDNASITNYSIYHNNVLIGTSATNTVNVDFSNVAELQTVETSGVNYVGLTIAVTDDKTGYSSKAFNFAVIKYTRPTIEVTSSNIRRKTSGGTTLTQSIATLTFVGTCYKGNDVIGNNNTPLVQYKIWNTTEPAYTSVTTPNTANITISNVQISNVDYLKVWDYKIKISDSFTDVDASPYIKVDKVPTGVSVWSEYKDHVDFLKLTVDKNNPFEYNENNEIKVGIYDDGNNEVTIYRSVFVGTSSSSSSVDISLTDLSADTVINAYGWVKSTYGQWWPISNHYASDSNYDTSTNYTSTSLSVNCGSYFSYPDYIIVIEYMK